MTATPVQSRQPSSGTSTQAHERRQPQEDAAARFRQTLAGGAPRSSGDPRTNVESRPNMDATPAVDRQSDIKPRSNVESRPGIDSRSGIEARPEIGPRPGIDPGTDPKTDTPLSRFARDADRRDPNTAALAGAMTIGSLHYSLPLAEVSAEPATTTDMTRLIEQATSVMIERASRADASRFIVSLDHAIVGGASAEFVRDGAFLHVRLLARNDAAYRSMWAHRAELEERLAASTGLATRVEIVEGYGDGRSA